MFGRKPSPEAEQEKKEMTLVKRRLTKVEARLQMLTTQVDVLRRSSEDE